jgi:hypothetical protein
MSGRNAPKGIPTSSINSIEKEVVNTSQEISARDQNLIPAS